MAETGALLEAYLGIRPSSPTEATLRLLIWTGLQILGADEGSLLVLDPATSDLRFVMTLGNETSGTMLIGQRIAVGEGITGLAAATREVQIGAPVYRDIAQSVRVDGSAPEAVIAAPMLIEERLIGVITGVSFAKGHRFDSQAGRMFGGFAVIAGVIVDQEQRLAALAEAAAHDGLRPGIAQYPPRPGSLRPDAVEDVATIIRLVEKLAQPSR